MNITQTIFILLPWLLNVAILLATGAYYFFNSLLALSKLLNKRSDDTRLSRLEREIKLLKPLHVNEKAPITESDNSAI